MAEVSEWDVNKYKTGYESEEHWTLRKKFMESHKEKFTEDEIVCLAQVFCNVEFLGCRYPAETMKRVSMLSDGIVDDYRKTRANRLKRTFIGASDAAANKVQRK